MNWTRSLRFWSNTARKCIGEDRCGRSSLWPVQRIATSYRHFGGRIVNDDYPLLDRSFLAQLWDVDRNLGSSREKRKRLLTRNGNQNRIAHYNHRNLVYESPFRLSTKDATFVEGKQWKQPPPSQSVSGFLAPHTPEEVQVAPLLARSNLLITRDIEWANLVLGFEQENRYAIVDVCYPQSPVGFIREQSNIVARQLLRLRRPFVAYITDAMGNELFRVRRPFWWLTSSIYAEIDGKEIGVVHRRWHLWRRVYDLYLGNKQFAVVENPGFWNWTFTLKDIDGNVLAEVDRDWRGFGFEMFTDAGQYVIRFGASDLASRTGPAKGVQELEVARHLTLSERAVAVALAISLDNDYFSRHGGWGLPFIAVGE
ncbi:altered inheritance rate of mitochondria protein 25 [Cucurbita pepo subsp. pepo]|uniref:altered inheritance rate of mitochondria protein 25 n=1 Tax=Cucurbita pepo subsp. pepo TaxID=3664 RepID=UPI000C9D6573|nr:altered inheritance rate of mitochondria protein 25 [Cucurbita pepo subsp. pepo]